MALTREQFRFIVEQRAIAITPDTVVINFGRQFKPATCTLDQVNMAAERDVLPVEWQKVWDDALRRFMNAPTSSREYRVALLHEKAMSERSRGAKFEHLIEQIAKEMADAYAPKGAPGKGAAAGGQPGDKLADSSITWKIVDPATGAA